MSKIYDLTVPFSEKSEISKTNQGMVSAFSGIRIVYDKGTSLLPIVYGTDEKLVSFVRRITEGQILTDKLHLPAAAINLRKISHLADHCLTLTYQLTAMTLYQEEQLQIVERIFDLMPLPLDQDGNKYCLKSHYSKVELLNIDLEAKLESESSLVQHVKCHVTKFLFNVTTNYAEKPNIGKAEEFIKPEEEYLDEN